MDRVLGAQFSGAELGGCLMILAKDEAVNGVVAKLEEEYYGKRGLEKGITISVPVKGFGLIRI